MTHSRELSRNQTPKYYRINQACAIPGSRFENCGNAVTLSPWLAEQAACFIQLQWTPEQFADKLPVSHEAPHVYSDNTIGFTLWDNFCSQKQKRKRYPGGRDGRGKLPHLRPFSERPRQIGFIEQVGHWECGIMIVVNPKCSIVIMVERKSGYGHCHSFSKDC